MKSSAIKLPRKRKKAFKRGHSDTDAYMMMQIANEVAYEDTPIKQNTKFYDFKIERNKIVITRYW